MNTLLILGIAHVIGDYLLQPDILVKKKHETKWGVPVHAVIYAAIICFALLWCVGWCNSWLSLLIIAVSHGAIDFVRVKIENNWEKQKEAVGTKDSGDSKDSVDSKDSGDSKDSVDSKVAKAELISFCIDQCLHLAFIFFCWKVYIRIAPMSDCFSSLCELSWFRTALIYIAIFAVIWDPASVFIKKVFGLFPKIDNQDDSYAKAGDLIGKLERLIVAALVLSGAASSIGFVLTAKSIARYKQIAGDETNSFAERYLIGTLLSVSIALVTVFLGTKLI